MREGQRERERRDNDKVNEGERGAEKGEGKG